MVGYTPAPRTPSRSIPAPQQPGRRQPDERPVETTTVTATGVSITGGTTDLGTPDGYFGSVESVTVEATATDFDFQLVADGEDQFDTPQSPGSTDPETFETDTERGEFEGDAPNITFEVTSGSAQNGADAVVSVVVTTETP